MAIRPTVYGAGANRDKTQRAKELRREMTPGEQILWTELRTNRLAGFHFRRQQVILGYIVDFYCHAASLVVEIDGSVHATQVERDKERDQALSVRGYRIVHFNDEEVHQNLPSVLHRILEALQQYT